MEELKPKITVNIESVEKPVKSLKPLNLPKLNLQSTKNLNPMSPIGKGLGLEKDIKTYRMH